MITEIVTFDLPPGTDRTAALVLYRQSARKWAANPDLIEKYYFFDEEKCLGGGVYIWPSREVAAKWHDEEYRQMVRSLYGAAPRIEIYDALIHVAAVSGMIEEL